MTGVSVRVEWCPDRLDTYGSGRTTSVQTVGSRLRLGVDVLFDVCFGLGGGEIDLEVVQTRLGHDLLADLDHEVDVLGQEVLDLLATLTELFAFVREPGARLLHDAEVDTHVEQGA